MRVVSAIKNRPAGLIEELAEDTLDRAEVAIEIEVLFFDVQDERVLGLEQLDRAVALVALCHEIFAARIPVRVGAKQWNLGSDVVRRVHPALPQDVRRSE